jgi:hypothetical protein
VPVVRREDRPPEVWGEAPGDYPRRPAVAVQARVHGRAGVRCEGCGVVDWFNESYQGV